MREQARYWTRPGPPTPDAADLPAGSFKGDEHAWGSLSPGMRREIWRGAILSEANKRNLGLNTIFRVQAMTISGSLASLDEYLDAIARADEARQAIAEDVFRLARADATHQKSETQIEARERV